MDFRQFYESRLVDQRMALAREWDELVEQVRALDGFEDFLRPPPLESLLSAATDGPVAVVNVSQWRCDALIVRADGVQVVELPELTLAAVVERTDDYLRVLRGAERRERALSGVRQRALGIPDDDPDPGNPDCGDQPLDVAAALRAVAASRRDREDTLHSIMKWLWETMAEPVLTALGYDQPPEAGARWPRVWWCPTGRLALLPIHGAGDHTVPGQAVVDRVISSYTPTLRALRQARQATRSAATTGDGPRLLVVAVPDALGEVQLVNVEREVERLRARFGNRCMVLSGPRATPAQVLAALADHPWVHFSCHGRQDLNDPSRAGLGLANHTTLTVTDLSARQQVGDLAFLAACQTATGGLHLPDEVITLAAAMHFTGFRHVIATLWSVSDEIAANVVEEVYERLGRSGRFDADEAAFAVHEAVRTVRAERALALSEWLPFTHTGP